MKRLANPQETHIVFLLSHDSNYGTAKRLAVSLVHAAILAFGCQVALKPTKLMSTVRQY